MFDYISLRTGLEDFAVQHPLNNARQLHTTNKTSGHLGLDRCTAASFELDTMLKKSTQETMGAKSIDGEMSV